MERNRPHQPRMQLKDINHFITCKICKGYFVDATTVTECLHTFCRSCIVKHFKKSLFCPECDVQVEKGCPLNKLRPDPRKQLIVYKLVPKLHQNEVGRQWNFLKKCQPVAPFSRPQSNARPLLPSDLPEEETIRDRIVDKIHLYSPDDKFSVSLEYDSSIRPRSVKQEGEDSKGCEEVEEKDNRHRRYLQCPGGVTVQHFKKFLRMKYEISPKFEIKVFYEGEEVLDHSSMMDIAYQFFYEAKAPMRFSYRIVPADPAKPAPKRIPIQNAIPVQHSTPIVVVTPITTTTMPTVTVPQPSPSPQPARGSPSANSSSDESSSTRRQQRQRSAKTAAYSAIGAMEEESDHDDADLPKRKKLAPKSPRWENEADSYTVYRNTRRTPKTSLDDFEARYNIRPAGKRVYAPCTDDESSDAETRRNTLANQQASAKYNHLVCMLKTDNKKHRRKADVYEFSVQNEDNEDSNTTQEFDFVYDNSDRDSATSATSATSALEGATARAEQAEQAEVEAEGGEYENGGLDDVDDMDADELAQHIEMEVVTDTEDIDQHIEDSIEEVEVDADDETTMHEEDNNLEADTTSSASLVIAEDDEDDAVVEEVIAAEEDGHELVVVEDPDESDVTYTVEVMNAVSTDGSEKEDASRSPGNSTSSKSPTVEEDEPEIVHEKVVRKKSKKSKHHHHHHKRKRHHSPVMLISSPEEAPMKLTLKLRPTPSISPGVSSRKSPLLPLPDSPTKDKKISLSFSPIPDTNGSYSPRSTDRSYKYSSQKIYTVKITPPKAPTPSLEKASATPRPQDKPRREALESKKEGAEGALTPPAETEKQDDDNDRKSVPNEVKERLTQMRQVRIKSTSNVPASPPPSPSPTKATPGLPDLTSMKTPSSLTISKIEMGESPQRPETPSTKPALEILVLPPSPPPSDKQCDESEDGSSNLEPPAKRAKVDESAASQSAVLTAPRDMDQTCVLDLSGPKRDTLPPSPAASPKSKPLVPEPPFVPPTALQLQQRQLVANNAQVKSIHQMMGEATLATMKRMSGIMGGAMGGAMPAKLPLLPLFNQSPLLVRSPPRRGMHPLQDILSAASRPVSGFAMPAATAARPGPNQSVRQIPNPSALLHRQKGGVDKDFLVKQQQQGQLTEQQLKERYQQFQQNRAKAAYTYSRASTAPSRSITITSSPVSLPGASVGHGVIPIGGAPTANKGAYRPRSIEKVAAGLLRAGAYAVEAQAGL